MPYISFKDLPRKKFKCPVRLIRICADNRIKRLSQFSEMSFNELLSLPECGEKTALLVREILQGNGLDFRAGPKLKAAKPYRHRKRRNAEFSSQMQQ